MTLIAITAPEGLRNSVENFLNGARTRDNSDYQTLRQTIIDFSNAIATGVVGANEFFKQETVEARKEFFAELVSWSNTVLADACIARGIDNILITTPTGIQGAGKGTYNDSMGDLAKEFASEIEDPTHGKFHRMAYKYPVQARRILQKSQTQEVKVGTGGIFAHKDEKSQIKTTSELEYFELFNAMKTGMGSASGRLVEDNIVAISVNLYMAVKILQNENGIRSFTADIYPRSTGQVELFLNTIETLRAKGVKLNHNAIDFKLLKEDEVQYLIHNKETALKIIPEVVKKFKQKYSYAIENGEYSFYILEADVNEIFASFEIEEEKKVAEVMRRECVEAINRAMKRGKESGRKDDTPQPLLKRLTEYLESSFSVPFFFENPIIIATNNTPEEVAKQFFSKFLNINPSSKDLLQGGVYYKLLRRYQTLVTRSVRGEFKFVLENRRLERNKINYTELVYYDKDSRTLYYTILTKDGQSITYSITSTGTRFKEAPDEVSVKELLARDLGIVIYRSETINSFWEKRPELWGLDKSFQI